jgi:DNA-binding IclR family transcriptional regulator
MMHHELQPRRGLHLIVAGTFRETPGISIPLQQAARLLGLPIGACERVLDELVRGGELRRGANGHYANS